MAALDRFYCTKQGIKCLDQGHNTVPPVRLEPATLPSRGKHSTTEPPLSSCVLAEKALVRVCVGTGLSEPFKMHKIIYYIQSNEIQENIDKILCIF